MDFILAVSFVFNIFSTVGLLALDACIQLDNSADKSIRYWCNLIVLLPSISFWSAGLGKDSISFMAACVALWASENVNKRMKSMAFAIVAMFFVRPHMAAVLVVALAVQRCCIAVGPCCKSRYSLDSLSLWLRQ